MKRVCANCVVFLLLLISTTSFGRIGETEQEAVQRYGSQVAFDAENIKPLFADLREMRFRFQDWRVRSVFIDGKTEAITYMKIERIVSREALLTTKDIEAILQAESLGGQWHEVEKREVLTGVERFQKIFAEASRIWRNDKGLIGWMRGDYAISIISEKALDHEKKSK